MLKILDRYIAKKLFGTFFFTLFFLTLIVVVVDISQAADRLRQNDSSITESLVSYYPYWVVYLANTFVQIVVFISVIFFTSKLTDNTEIVAMQSGGVSFHRIARPYFFSALLITLFVLFINHFLLPYANEKKNDFYNENRSSKNQKLERNKSKKIAAFISRNEQLNILRYNKKSKTGAGFSYFKFGDSLDRSYMVMANQVNWDSTNASFHLTGVYEKFGDIHANHAAYRGTIRQYEDSVAYHKELNIKLNTDPDLLLPENNAYENLNTPDLLKFIERKRIEGSGKIPLYLTDFYQRTALPVSTFILAILGLVLSSRKRRGGIGANLAIGILLAFSYVFLTYILKVISSENVVSPFMAALFPNLLFGLITAILYIRRANQ